MDPLRQMTSLPVWPRKWTKVQASGRGGCVSIAARALGDTLPTGSPPPALGTRPMSPACDHRVPAGGAAGPGPVLRERTAPRGVLREQKVPGVPGELVGDLGSM